MKRTIYILTFFFMFACITIISCTGVKKKINEKYYKKLIPQAFVILADTLYYDKTENRCLDWCEYMYWTKRVFGGNSEEFEAIKPDTLVWDDNKCLNYYYMYYMRHPAFRNFPSVGISQKQAEDYSKWRSDRVFEYMLVKLGKVSFDPDQNRDSHFTIEDYFNGTYHNQKPDTTIKYYPQYRLPTVNEWQLAIKYMDSIDNSYYHKHRNQPWKKSNKACAKYQCGIIPCRNDTFINYPTRYVFSDTLPKRRKIIYNLRGNVSEWTSENSICVGGGWKDSKKMVLTQDTFFIKHPNAETSFRNVCVWREWKDNAP